MIVAYYKSGNMKRSQKKFKSSISPDGKYSTSRHFQVWLSKQFHFESRLQDAKKNPQRSSLYPEQALPTVNIKTDSSKTCRAGVV